MDSRAPIWDSAGATDTDCLFIGAQQSTRPTPPGGGFLK